MELIRFFSSFIERLFTMFVRTKYRYQVLFGKSMEMKGDVKFDLPLACRRSSGKYWRIQCDNKCGDDFITKQDMEEHLSTVCPISVLPCSYAYLGCEFEGMEKERAEHNVSDVHEHLKLSLGKIEALENEVKQQKQESIENQENMDSKIETHVIGSIVSNCIMESRFEMLEKVAEEHISSFEEKLRMHEIIFEEKIRSLERKLKQYVGSAIKDIRAYQDEQMKSNVVVTEVTKEEVKIENNSNHTQQRILPTLPVTTNGPSPIDKAREKVERSNYGVVLWEIKDYKRLLGEATKSNNRLYSEPFFTVESGFKLRLYACLNGVRAGRGTHLAFYFQIMKGQNDESLEWPFFHKHTISLLNHFEESKNRQHVTDSKLTSDTFKNLHYQQPTVGHNFGCGKGSFISHEDVVNDGFLMNDTIYLLCEIE